MPVFLTVPTMFSLPSASTNDDWAIIFTESSAEYAPVLNDKMTTSASTGTANMCILYDMISDLYIDKKNITCWTALACTAREKFLHSGDFNTAGMISAMSDMCAAPI